MASGKDEPKAGRAGTGRQRPVRPATIDLEATPVEDPAAAGKGATGTPAAAGPAKTGHAAAPDSPAPDAASRDTAPASDDGAARSGTAAEPASSGVANEVSQEAENATPSEPSAAEAAPVREEPVPLPTARRASLIAAGIIGALLGLALYLGLYFSGWLTRDPDTQLQRLQAAATQAENRVAMLESQIAGMTRADPEARFERRVAALESAVQGLAGSAQEGIGERIADLEERLAALPQDAEAAGGDLAARLEALEGRVAAQPAAAGTGVDEETFDALQAAVEELRTSLADVDSRIKALTERDASADESEQARLAKLESDLSQARSDIAGLREQADQQLSTLAEQVEGVAGRVDATASRANRVLALAALRRAVDSGTGFQNELASLQPLLPQAEALAPLAAYAESGIPTISMLRRQLEEAEPAIVDAGQGNGDGVVGRLIGGARSLVQIRPAGEVAGDSRIAILSRVDGALADGDPETAAREWQNLDETARAAAADWERGLQARIAANAALDRLAADGGAAGQSGTAQ